MGDKTNQQAGRGCAMSGLFMGAQGEVAPLEIL
jgi:hypothetical protein